MNRTRSAWLSTALLCAALLAGCGSSNSTTTSTASSTPPATQSTPATTSTSAPGTTTTSTAKSHSVSPARFAAAICKSTAGRAKLSGALKAQVDAICHDYESGDTAKAKSDAENACTKAIEAIPTESSAKRQALARCKGK